MVKTGSLYQNILCRGSPLIVISYEIPLFMQMSLTLKCRSSAIPMLKLSWSSYLLSQWHLTIWATPTVACSLSFRIIAREGLQRSKYAWSAWKFLLKQGWVLQVCTAYDDYDCLWIQSYIVRASTTISFWIKPWSVANVYGIHSCCHRMAPTIP